MLGLRAVCMLFPFVFCFKMKFRIRLYFTSACLIGFGVLCGYHLGKMSVENPGHVEITNQKLEPRSHTDNFAQLVPDPLNERQQAGSWNGQVIEGAIKEIVVKSAHRPVIQEKLELENVKKLNHGEEMDKLEAKKQPEIFSLKPRPQMDIQIKDKHIPIAKGIHVHIPPIIHPAEVEKVKQSIIQPNDHLKKVSQDQLPVQKLPPESKQNSDVLPKPISQSDSIQHGKKIEGDAPRIDTSTIQSKSDSIHLSVVVCGDRTNETLVMLKSAAALTKTHLVFHICAEDELQDGIKNMLNSWPSHVRERITFHIYPITFPEGENPAEWKKVFKLCATQRLFLPDLLKYVDSLLYVDTDILFIRPLEKIWHFFKRFNTTQLAALAPEHEVTNIGWYNRFARHPYYGLTGLNSGVMLMNLTRMREFDWVKKVVPVYRKYRLNITWGDQDIINILFHFHPEAVYVYDCEWNYRPDHCMYGNNCPRIVKEGVSVIHGNRGVYHNEKQLPFRAIYEAFRDYEFGADIQTALIHPLKEKWSQQNIVNMYCTKALREPIIATLSRYLQQNVSSGLR